MALRVAFDLDGTVADMQVVLRRESERLFGTPGTPDAATDTTEVTPKVETEAARAMIAMHLTSQQRTELWDHVRATTDFWLGLPEMEPGIVARIAATAAARRWEVLFLTTRPSTAGDTTQVQSQRWLEAHGFVRPSVFVVRRSRGKVAEALELDAVVDDRPENCLDVAAESRAKAILVWTHEPVLLPPAIKRVGIRVVGSISAALDVLIRLDDSRTDSSVVRSIRRLLGREPTA